MNALPKKIAVLMGGPGSERDVSLATARGVAKALRSRGAEVFEIDVRDENFELPRDIDLAFLTIHGTFGEDGQLQQILENRGMPYTGDGIKESWIAFDKIEAKKRFEAAGVTTPRWQVIGADEGHRPRQDPRVGLGMGAAADANEGLADHVMEGEHPGIDRVAAEDGAERQRAAVEREPGRGGAGPPASGAAWRRQGSVSVLGRTVSLPLSRAVGAPLPRLRGVTGKLARQNAMRNPKRTAASASALMIGVGLIAFISIFASSAKASINATIDRTFAGDFVINSGAGQSGGGVDPALAQMILAKLRTLHGRQAA